VYAHYTYTEALQTACFTGFLLALARMLEERDGRSAAWLGAAAALVVDAKIVYAAALPGAAALVVWTLRREPRRIPRLAGAALATFLPLFALVPFYNWARFGSPLDSGYNAYAGVHFSRGSLWTGLWGLFLSPGKSVFLYNPPLLAALAGLGALGRRAPRLALAVAATVAPVVLLNARSAFWHGDWAWGPRYLVFALPAALLPLALVIDRLREAGRRLAVPALVGGALAVGGFVQVLGLAFYWDHWVRIAAWDVKPQWLGQPNRGGATLPSRGAHHGPHCDACFEDMFAHQWLPPLSPLAGHLWMLRHVPFGHEWSRAQEDAPWRRATTLRFASAYYDQAKDKRLDWWILEWAQLRGLAALVMGGLGLMLAAGALLWRRALAPPRPPESARPASRGGPRADSARAGPRRGGEGMM
jgi:hypothetical protein